MEGAGVYKVGYVILAVVVRMSVPALGHNDDADDSSPWSQFPDEDAAFLTPSQRMLSSSMMKFVIMRGCDYTAGFVKNHYFPHSGRSDINHDTCNIRELAEHRCEQNQVPPELCCAILSCGDPHIAFVFDVDDKVLRECNLTRDVQNLHMTPVTHGQRRDVSTETDTRSLVNMRQQRNHPTPPDMCDHFPQDAYVAIGKRDNDEHPHSGVSVIHTIATFLSHLTIVNNGSSVQTLNPTNETVANSSGHTPPFTLAVQRWCKRFSRAVNHNYGFSGVPYVRHSLYWVQDVYATCRQRTVPKHYAHSLVGCGIDIAMDALDAPQWLTALYKLVL